MIFVFSNLKRIDAADALTVFSFLNYYIKTKWKSYSADWID